jgi:hypothetical protein
MKLSIRGEGDYVSLCSNLHCDGPSGSGCRTCYELQALCSNSGTGVLHNAEGWYLTVSEPRPHFISTVH